MSIPDAIIARVSERLADSHKIIEKYNVSRTIGGFYTVKCNTVPLVGLPSEDESLVTYRFESGLEVHCRAIAICDDQILNHQRICTSVETRADFIVEEIKKVCQEDKEIYVCCTCVFGRDKIPKVTYVNITFNWWI